MLQKVSDKVEELLRRNPAYQDNDNRLIAQYWNEQISGTAKDITAHDFLGFVARGEVEKADNITRARRKLQEHYPELQGTKWQHRHNKQADVKKELREMEPKV